MSGAPCPTLSSGDGSSVAHTKGDEVSENLRLLGKYGAAMESGDGDAVYEFSFSEDFHSHVAERVSPERVGHRCAGRGAAVVEAGPGCLP